jgi:hypothetical protein
MVGGFRYQLIRFYLDINFRSLFKLNFSTLLVGQTVGNSNLAVEVIGPFDGNLRFFWFAGIGMRLNKLFNDSW